MPLERPRVARGCRDDDAVAGRAALRVENPPVVGARSDAPQYGARSRLGGNVEPSNPGSCGGAGAQRHIHVQVHVAPETADEDVDGATPGAHPADAASQVQFQIHVVGAVAPEATGAGSVTPDGAVVVAEIGTVPAPATFVWVTGPSLPGLSILMLTFTLPGADCAAVVSAAAVAVGDAGTGGADATSLGPPAATAPAAGAVAAAAPGTGPSGGAVSTLDITSG
jgi:hypothetical protein